MDDQTPSASTPVFKIKTKIRQRSARPYDRPSQSWGGKLVDSVSSISDWLKNAASYLTNTQTEGEIDVNEQSVLSNSSSRSATFNEMPSEIRDASIRPSLCVLREEQEDEEEHDGDNETRAEVNKGNMTQTAPTAASTPCPPARDAPSSEEQRVTPAPSTSSELLSAPVPVSRDASNRLSLSIGTMNRLDIPEDNLKRLKVNLSKRNRYSMPCSNISTSPPSKASRHETVDSSTTRVARNSDIFGLNSTLSSSFTFGPRSPFYDGRTSFGGSSSRRMSRLALPYSMAARKTAPILKVRASEMAKSDCGRSEALSCASLKILDVINKESSLLEDTKKIPLNDSSGLSNKAVFNNFVNSTRRVSSSKPTTRLSMPSHITTSLFNKSMGSIHQTESTNSNIDWRLNPTTFADDVHAPSGTSASNLIEKPLHQKSFNQETNLLKDRVGGKMKSSVSGTFSNRSSRLTTSKDECVPVVNLPQISLPPLKNLPSFNLDCKTSDSSTNDINQFKFSWPSTQPESSREVHKVTSTSTTAKAFTFSNPLEDANDSSANKLPVNSTTIPKNGPTTSPPVIADASWSCPKCIYRNDPQVNQCLACKTLRNNSNPTSSSFQFSVKSQQTLPLAPSSSSFSSSSTSSKAAIVTAFAASSATTTTITTTSSTSTPSSTSFSSFTTTASSWGDKFKKAPGAWTCDVCMVDNKSDCNQCVACETPKPGAQSTTTAGNNNFTLNNGSINLTSPTNISKKWTCDTCYVKNEENRDTCSSCEMSRKATDIGTKQASYSGYKFNLTDKNPPPFKFGISSTVVTAAPATVTTTITTTVPTIALSTAPTGPIDQTRAAKKDALIETSFQGKSSNLITPNVTSVFSFDAGKKSSLASSSPIITTTAVATTVPTLAFSTLTGPLAIDESRAAKKDAAVIETSVLSKPSNLIAPNVTSVFSFDAGKKDSLASSSIITTTNSTTTAVSTLATVTSTPAIGISNNKINTTPAVKLGFNFTPDTQINFAFGNPSTGFAPKFGVPATSNGSFGSASTTPFTFTGAATSNGSFGSASTTPFTFTGAAASNGSFGSASTGPFTFTGATGGTDGTRSGDNASRVVKKARRRLANAK